jgi:Helicase HerA, central domain
MTDVPTIAVPRGQLYVGEQINAATHSRDGKPVTLAASDFTTHGVIVGMTGSGKTGLGVVLLEEALLSGVPALIIDPKGDLTNLELTFPELRAADFRPWINDGDAQRAGATPDAFAEQEATKWRDGLASWGVTPERIGALRAAVDFTIYTPGSTSGVPLNLVGSLQAPKGADAETIGDEVEGFVSGLLGLVDIDADPLASREHILLSNIVAASWNEGRDLDLATLVGQVQQPPMRKLGVFEVDTFFPPADRTALALRLNGLLASPSFAAWAQGVPFDIDRLLRSADGKPAAAIVTIAHLSDAERQFVVSLLLGKLVTWMRRQSGTTDLRALVYMDEVSGYAPPTAEPPSKKPILTLLKQARAFGVGLVLSTQNPVDLDYKAISNAGTWMVGRLQTEQDKKRLLDGMSAAGGGVDVNELGATISGLGKREFVLRRAGVDQPAVFTTRWAMAYLRGPLTREQIASLTPKETSALPPPPPGVAAASLPPPGEMAPPTAEASPVAPKVADSVPVRYLDPATPWAAQVGAVPNGSHLVAAAVARVSMVFDDDKAGLREVQEWEAVLCPLPSTPDPSAAVSVDYDERNLVAAAPPGSQYVLCDAPIGTKTYWTSLQRNLVDQLVRTRTMQLQRNATLKLYSRVGETSEQFAARCAEAADAAADHKLALVRDKYAPKYERARAALATAQDKVEVQAAQAKAERNDGVIGAVSGLLDGFMRGRSNARSMSRSISRSTGKASTANKRLESASNRADEKQDALADLEREFQAELAEVHAEADAAAATIDTMPVPLEKTDVKVVDIALVWVPRA